MKMHLVLSSLLIFFSIFIVFDLSNALDCGSKQVARTITVDILGRGDFNTIQKAIDSIPAGNNKWIHIFVKPGIYRERVNIAREKPCIFLEGSGTRQTIIAWNGNVDVTAATFTASADNFVAKSITFQNFFNRPIDSNEDVKQAVAAAIIGDKAAFYQCAFIGLQDTLWDVQGRHYFNSCYIEGAVDFIWGNGQSLYENTAINVTAAKLDKGTIGFITAQGRDLQSDPSGFLFLRGVITGSGKVYLGRAYRSCSRVVFQGTKMDGVVVPLGWNPRKYFQTTQNLFYAEVNCTGPGSVMSQRVNWERRSNDPQLKPFLASFSGFRNQWLAGQPS